MKILALPESALFHQSCWVWEGCSRSHSSLSSKELRSLSLLQWDHQLECSSDSTLSTHTPSASKPPFPSSIGWISEEANGSNISKIMNDAVAALRPAMGLAGTGYV